MSFSTHIIAADDDDFPALASAADPLSEWSGIEAPGFDTTKLALLDCLLTGDLLQTALERYQPLYSVGDETIVVRLSDFVVEKLAAFDAEALAEIAGELAATQDFEREQWPVDAVSGRLSELAELAQLAESQGQALFARIVLALD